MEELPEVVVTGSHFDMGLQVGRAFSAMIRGRLARDPVLHSSLLPFCHTDDGRAVLAQLFKANRERYPGYWEEIRGTAAGSDAPFEELLVLNMRKEIGAFLPRAVLRGAATAADQCTSVLCCRPGAAFVAHNEDADESVRGHAYLVRAERPGGGGFTAFTYAGELPSCAFGFNTCGIAFSLNAVPPAPSEVVAGGIARNFVSRDILESASYHDALRRARVPDLAAGHHYNIMDVGAGRACSLETASRGRSSLLEVGAEPYFHANMYQRLQLEQTANKTSVHRCSTAERIGLSADIDFALKLLGDRSDAEYPIYMTGTAYEGGGRVA